MHVNGAWQAISGVLSKDMSSYVSTFRFGSWSSPLKKQCRQSSINKKAKRVLKVKYSKRASTSAQGKYLGENWTGRSGIADTLSRIARSWHHASRFWHGLLAPVGVLEQQRCALPRSPWCIQPQSSVFLFGAAMLIPALLNLLSTTICELWLDACVLHQRTNWSSSQAYNLLSFVAMELHRLQHAVPSSLETCFTQRLDFHRKQIYGTSNWDTHLCSPNNNSSVCLTTTINCRRGALGGSPMKCGEGGQPFKAPNFYLRHQRPHPLNDPPKNSLGPASPPQHLWLTFRLLLLHMGMVSSATCVCGAEEQTVKHFDLQPFWPCY